jgi:glycosyltransferase involved in cell wall biosynthesis
MSLQGQMGDTILFLRFSVVICTHNRANLARNAIISVLEQDFPQEQYELLIIDNASTDGTRQMTQEFCSIYSNVRYIFEPNIGLSHARNCGWREAKGQYVGYLDDDGKAAPGWLAAAGEVAGTIYPEAFGGPYYAFYDSPKAKWFNDKYGSSEQGVVARSLQAYEYLSGGNMFIRRDLLLSHGGFKVDMGMKGSKVAYGEETLFFNQLRAGNHNAVLFYHPDVFIYHLVRPDKMSIWSWPVRFYSSGFYSARTRKQQKYALFGIVFQITKIIFIAFISFFRGIFFRNVNKYPFFANYLYEVVFPQFWELGWAISHWQGFRETE